MCKASTQELYTAVMSPSENIVNPTLLPGVCMGECHMWKSIEVCHFCGMDMDTATNQSDDVRGGGLVHDISGMEYHA